MWFARTRAGRMPGMRISLCLSTLLACSACRALAPNVSPISTDRPGLLFASSVVPRGVTQLEIGAPAVQLDKNRGVDARSTALSVQGRYGLSDTLELRVGGAPLGELRVDGGGNSVRERGASDLELGAKYALADDPSSVLLAVVRVPSGADGLSADEPAYSLFAASEWALAGERSIKGIVGWTGEPSGSDWIDTVTLGLLLNQTVTQRFSVYGEAVAFPVLSGGDEPAYLGLGAAYLLSSDLQLDVSADFGMNDAAIDSFLTAGVSVRW